MEDMTPPPATSNPEYFKEYYQPASGLKTHEQIKLEQRRNLMLSIGFLMT